MSKAGAQIISGESVSVVIARKIKAGCENEFWALEKKLFAEAARCPGFLTVNHFPTTGGEEGEYVSILQYDSVEHLLAWEKSPVRNELLGEINQVLEYEPRRKSITGLEGMFDSPVPVGPPRYKMMIVMVAIIFGLFILLEPLMGRFLSGAPKLLQTFVLIVVQVGIMTYWVLPTVTKRLSAWLYRR